MDSSIIGYDPHESDMNLHYYNIRPNTATDFLVIKAFITIHASERRCDKHQHKDNHLNQWL